MTRQELATRIYSTAHLTGNFVLRSGKTSTEYFDKYRFEANPELLREIAKQLAPLIPAQTDALAGLEMGGIPIATALSLQTGLPVCFVRKEAKSYGTRQFAEGIEIKGRRLCIVEDVVTTGGQMVISANDLRQAGALVRDVLCVIYRGEDDLASFQKHDLQLLPLFTKQELTPKTDGR